MVFERPSDTKFGTVYWNRTGCNGGKPYNNLEFRGKFDITGFYVRHCTDSNSNNKVDPVPN